MRKYLIVFIAVLSVSCGKETKKKFEIEGKLSGMPSQKVTLERRGVSETVTVDTTTTDKNGKYKLTGNYDQDALYTLTINNHSLPFVVDNEHILLNANSNELDNYTISNSPASKELVTFNQKYLSMRESVVALKLVMDSLNENNGPDSVKLELQRRGDAQMKAISDFVKNYADETKNLPLIFYATSLYLDPYDDADYFKKLSTSLPARFNHRPLAVEFASLLKNKQQIEASRPSGPKLSEQAPDFSLPDVSGKMVALSSFKGKYVLLDFWASWCNPCRGQNIYLVSVYNQFKNQGFTIVSVSLDHNAEDWKKTIKTDRLTWTNLRANEKYQSEVAQLYGVHAIPTNILIDTAGVIVAKDLIGDEVSTVLLKVLPGSTQ